jgi:hypothetical protein
MNPREKPNRRARLLEFNEPPQKDHAPDRETEVLRALVQVLAREAARDAFEGALAEQEQARLEDKE